VEAMWIFVTGEKMGARIKSRVFTEVNPGFLFEFV
jgi:hypothetical protein